MSFSVASESSNRLGTTPVSFFTFSNRCLTLSVTICLPCLFGRTGFLSQQTGRTTINSKGHLHSPLQNFAGPAVYYETFNVAYIFHKTIEHNYDKRSRSQQNSRFHTLEATINCSATRAYFNVLFFPLPFNQQSKGFWSKKTCRTYASDTFVKTHLGNRF